jgi:hypothetical protein
LSQFLNPFEFCVKCRTDTRLDCVTAAGIAGFVGQCAAVDGLWSQVRASGLSLGKILVTAVIGVVPYVQYGRGITFENWVVLAVLVFFARMAACIAAALLWRHAKMGGNFET